MKNFPIGRTRLLARLDQFHEQRFQRVPCVGDLVIAVGSAVLQPVHSGFAGTHRGVLPLRRQPLRQRREHRVMAHRVVVVDILLGQRDRRDALADQRAHAVNRALAIAAIDEAGGHPVEQPDGPVDVAKQQRRRLQIRAARR
ncbi:hypothetical protein USDA257_p02380 (plasmid) [Sinorhizobium fredii USDA 257]|uniref:Uncharacterized protein n=1 Tax=Sinorhizobium fredii (strain USDA 257) TaxID=1185652 RepID=I3XGE7_SINF2|nr:hypothetical protein USDA257_p02380 [Sinorhizobium fredii USDA 257]